MKTETTDAEKVGAVIRGVVYTAPMAGGAQDEKIRRAALRIVQMLKPAPSVNWEMIPRSQRTIMGAFGDTAAKAERTSASAPVMTPDALAGALAEVVMPMIQKAYEDGVRDCSVYIAANKTSHYSTPVSKPDWYDEPDLDTPRPPR